MSPTDSRRGTLQAGASIVAGRRTGMHQRSTSLAVRPRPTVHRIAIAVLCAGVVIALFGSAAMAQRGFGGFGGRLPEGAGVPIRSPKPGFEDGRLAHCKIEYTSVRREAMGVGWGTDYP